MSRLMWTIVIGIVLVLAFVLVLLWKVGFDRKAVKPYVQAHRAKFAAWRKTRKAEVAAA